MGSNVTEKHFHDPYFVLECHLTENQILYLPIGFKEKKVKRFKNIFLSINKPKTEISQWTSQTKFEWKEQTKNSATFFTQKSFDPKMIWLVYWLELISQLFKQKV